MVGEESGIDPLYKLFGISPKDVVKGRYLLATLFVGSMILIGIVLAFIISLIFQINNGALTILVTAPIVGLVTLFIIFMEYPIYFKYGIKKEKHW
ncbi:ABC-2 transporter permease [Streptococcus penaeicida]|uniref:ABC-2 transporter permease n=1 Tax=Streptococcus penaeicida TaxID=1765960 RepID=UPI001C2BC0A1|nr:ABC-2 transporter permease [Streptococcus penaeicida]